MRKVFRQFRRLKPLIRDKYLFDKGYASSAFEYTSLWGSHTISLKSFASIWFKCGFREELKVTPRVWFSRVRYPNYCQQSQKRMIVVSITPRMNLIYGKKPKGREWKQIKQFIQANRVAIQRHWSHETDSIGLFEDLVDLNGVRIYGEHFFIEKNEREY